MIGFGTWLYQKRQRNAEALEARQKQQFMLAVELEYRIQQALKKRSQKDGLKVLDGRLGDNIYPAFRERNFVSLLHELKMLQPKEGDRKVIADTQSQILDADDKKYQDGLKNLEQCLSTMLKTA